MMSGLPPGEVPTRMRSGRCGQFCCARAGSVELAGESGGERKRAAASESMAFSLSVLPVLMSRLYGDVSKNGGAENNTAPMLSAGKAVSTARHVDLRLSVSRIGNGP